MYRHLQFPEFSAGKSPERKGKSRRGLRREKIVREGEEWKRIRMRWRGEMEKERGENDQSPWIAKSALPTVKLWPLACCRPRAVLLVLELLVDQK
jgi:hypothetical protein